MTASHLRRSTTGAASNVATWGGWTGYDLSDIDEDASGGDGQEMDTDVYAQQVTDSSPFSLHAHLLVGRVF